MYIHIYKYVSLIVLVCLLYFSNGGATLVTSETSHFHKQYLFHTCLTDLVLVLFLFTLFCYKPVVLKMCLEISIFPLGNYATHFVRFGMESI